MHIVFHTGGLKPIFATAPSELRIVLHFFSLRSPPVLFGGDPLLVLDVRTDRHAPAGRLVTIKHIK